MTKKPILLIDVLKKNGDEHLYDEIVKLIVEEADAEDDYDDDDEEED
jgi:hypothetical protein